MVRKKYLLKIYTTSSEGKPKDKVFTCKLKGY